MTLRFRLWAVLLHLLFSAVAAQAGIRPADMAVLVDDSGHETIAGVMRPEVAARFVATDRDVSAGLSKAAYWLRFTVPATGAEQWLEVQPPFIDDVRLYEPSAAGMLEHRAGDLLPLAAREVEYRGFVFRLQTAPQARVMYLRVVNAGPVLSFVRLWEPAAFHAAANLEASFFGALFGLMIAVLVLNLIHWLWLREPLYGWFCLHVFVGILLNLSINGFFALWPWASAPELADEFTRVILLLAVSAGAPFYRQIVHLERGNPLYFAYPVTLMLPLLLFVPELLGYTGFVLRVILVTMLLLVVVALVQSVRLCRSHGTYGMLITGGIMITMFGLSSSSITYLGLVPGDIWLMHGRQISSVGYILAMHIAVASSLRETQTARQAALARASTAEAQMARERQVQREQGQFIAMLSHEIKNPLAVIDSATQSLARLPGAGEAEIRQRHERIRRSVATINGLVEKFLDQDRIDDPRLRVNIEVFDLGALLHEMVDADMPGHDRLRLDAPASLCLRGDAGLLRIAVGNLIDNALKYSPDPAPVELRLEAIASGVAITVADRGQGIDKPELLSQKYVRGQQSGGISGAGLGLYLVRRIAQLHGGDLSFAARPDGGTDACLRLPQEVEPA